MAFEEFCSDTSLHGWRFVPKSKHPISRTLWVFIAVSSIGVAGLFIYTAVKDFVSATVVTTFKTTTAPLSEVFFPAVVLCNINQIRGSIFKRLGIGSNATVINLLFEEFYIGRDRHLNEKELEIIKSLATSEPVVRNLWLLWELYMNANRTGLDYHSNMTDWKTFLEENRGFIESFDFLKDLAIENPGESSVLKISFEQQILDSRATDFLPFFGTDIGFCSMLKPQLSFNKTLDHLPYMHKMFGHYSHNWNISKGAKVGKANGLSMWLDAETFDYTYHVNAGEGFKLAIMHHLDQPIMSIRELDISPGFESQVAVTPTLYETSEEARTRFLPRERGCYFEGELPLKYLEHGIYRYDISNCLFQAAYEKILEECRCTPYFHWGGLPFDDFCRGKTLKCMNNILGRIGQYNTVDGKPCLAACEDQKNSVSITTSRNFNREIFTRRPEFCLLYAKLQITCKGWKRGALTEKYPDLCQTIAKVKETVPICPRPPHNQDNSTSMALLDPILFTKLNGSLLKLRDELYVYARDNLAVVNIYIKDATVTKIRRDQKVPIIWFIANCGGILGLCMGFSLITIFEIGQYTLQIIGKKLRRHMGHICRCCKKNCAPNKEENGSLNHDDLAKHQTSTTISHHTPTTKNGDHFDLVETMT